MTRNGSLLRARRRISEKKGRPREVIVRGVVIEREKGERREERERERERERIDNSHREMTSLSAISSGAVKCNQERMMRQRSIETKAVMLISISFLSSGESRLIDRK